LTTFSVVIGYQRFLEVHAASIFSLELEPTWPALRNVNILPQYYTALQPRRHRHEPTPSWKPVFLGYLTMHYWLHMFASE